MREHGQRNLVTVDRISKHLYRIVDGRARVAAARQLSITSMICQIRGEPGEHEIQTIQLRD